MGYTEWKNGYYFFAGHNCDIYDLKLNIITDVGDFNNVVELSEGARVFNADQMCHTVANSEGDDYDICTFILTPHNRYLGIALSEKASADFRITTEWSDCVDNLYPYDI